MNRGEKTKARKPRALTKWSIWFMSLIFFGLTSILAAADKLRRVLG
jgi:hypothetical protein